jgi:hypothetical protein
MEGKRWQSQSSVPLPKVGHVLLCGQVAAQQEGTDRSRWTRKSVAHEIGRVSTRGGPLRMNGGGWRVEEVRNASEEDGRTNKE